MKLVKCPKAFQAAELDGELLIIHGETGRFYALKDVGLEVWRKLDEESDLDRLCTALTREFDADEQTVRDDVASFAADIVEIGFAEYR